MTHARLLVTLALMGACAACLSSRRAEGEACDATASCEEGLECVIVDDGASFCLPRPPGRVERTCNVDDNCTLSDGQLWPIEAECLDGSCRCLGADVFCSNSGDDLFDVILEEETCRCVDRGGEGDSCITSHTCGVGLACTSGECRSAPGEIGAACLPGAFDETRCDRDACVDFRDGNDVGVCL